MLPRKHRLVRTRDFQTAVRSGRRAGTRRVVVHAYVPPSSVDPALVGLSVSRAVGNSVVRHRVSRQLRHLMSAQIERVPPGSLVMVRANPAAAGADSADLGRDLDKALRRVLSESRGGQL